MDFVVFVLEVVIGGDRIVARVVDLLELANLIDRISGTSRGTEIRKANDAANVSSKMPHRERGSSSKATSDPLTSPVDKTTTGGVIVDTTKESGSGAETAEAKRRQGGGAHAGRDVEPVRGKGQRSKVPRG